MAVTAKGQTVPRVPVGERVVAVEEQLKALTETVRVGFEEVKQQIERQSMNGRTERAKALVDAVGSPEDRDTLRSMIRAHDRHAWLARPLSLWLGGFSVAGAAAAVGALVGHALTSAR